MKQLWKQFKQEFILNKQGDFFFHLSIFLSFLIIGFIIYKVVFVSQLLGYANNDDAVYIIYNPCIRGISFNHLACIFTHTFTGKWEPLHLLVYMLIYQCFGLSGPMFHIVNLLLNIIDSFFVYLIVFKMMKNKSMALLSGIFYLIAPIQIESIMETSELKTTLANMFIFSSFLVYVIFRGNDKKGVLILSIILWILGLMSKATAITLPMMFFFYDYFYYPGKLNKALKWYAVGFGIGIAFIITYFLFLGTGTGTAAAITNRLQMAIINTAGLFSYPLTQIFPLHLLPYYFPLPMFSWLSPRVILSILFIFLMLFIIWYYRHRLSFISFWLIWYGINFVPGSGIASNVPQHTFGMLNAQGYYHYLSLPFVGLACVIGYILISMYRSVREKPTYKLVYFILLFTIIISISIISIKFSYMGKDDISYSKSLAIAYKQEPIFPAILVNTYLIKGNEKEAGSYLIKLEKEFPHSPFTYYYKGIMYVLRNKDSEARHLFKQAVYGFMHYKVNNIFDFFYAVNIINNQPFSDTEVYRLRLQHKDVKNYYTKILCADTLAGAFSEHLTFDEIEKSPLNSLDYFKAIIFGCKFAKFQDTGNACKLFKYALNYAYENPSNYNYNFLLQKVIQKNCAYK